jgi:tripartite-type tricarboxylate transporter receptor subunit TctC
MGSYTPAKTPSAIVERLNSEVNKALENPDVKKKIQLLGGETELMSVDQFNAFIAKEREVNAAIVKMIGFKPR